MMLAAMLTEVSVPRGGKTMRVIVELAKGSTEAVARVTIHFQT